MDITLFQQDIAWGDANENRRRVESALAEANGCGDIFVVPETFTTGFGGQMTGWAEPAEGPTLQWARLMAARHDTLFVGTWVVSEGGRCYNRLHWVMPDGQYGHCDKAHTFRMSSEAEQITAGRERPVFEWRGWRVRPAVCYDLRFPTWLRNRVVDNGDSFGHDVPALEYDLLLLCSNWPVARRGAWDTLIRARAIENLCYVAACNRTGTDNAGTPYNGGSAVIDYKGSDVGSGDILVRATMDKERLNSFRRRWPFHLDFD